MITIIVNVGGKTEKQKQNFASHYIIINSGHNHQWMKLPDESLVEHFTSRLTALSPLVNLSIRKGPQAYVPPGVTS